MTLKVYKLLLNLSRLVELGSWIFWLKFGNAMLFLTQWIPNKAGDVVADALAMCCTIGQKVTLLCCTPIFAIAAVLITPALYMVYKKNGLDDFIEVKEESVNWFKKEMDKYRE